MSGWIPPIGLAFWRWSIALICLFPFALPHIRNEIRLAVPHWRVFLAMGILSVGLFNPIVYLAAHYTTTHQVGLITSTTPIWIMVIVALFQLEKITWLKTLGTLVALSGAIVIVLQGNFNSLSHFSFNLGDQLALVGAIIWAIYSVLLRYRPTGMHPSVFMFLLAAIGLITMLPGYLYEMSQGQMVPVTLHAILIYLYIGIFASIIAWFCWNEAIARLGAVSCGLISYTMPVFTSLLAIVILHEPLAWYHIVGFILILLGIGISTLHRSKPSVS